MKINIVYDASVNSAPAGFQTGVAAAVDFLDKEFANPVTITIHVGYGEVGGQALDANALGESFYPVAEPETYSSVRNALITEAAPGVSTLPSTSPFSGTLYLTPAEAIGLGLPLTVSDGGVEGYVGFSSIPGEFSYANGVTPPFNQYYFIGTVEHEVTEIMGRVSLVGQQPSAYSPMDLYRYSANGVRDLAAGAGGSLSTAYFSVDNGATRLGTWNNDPSNGDLGDWYPSGPAAGGNDFFNDYSNPGVINAFSQDDVINMEALGWLGPITVTRANSPYSVSAGVVAANDLGAERRLDVRARRRFRQCDHGRARRVSDREGRRRRERYLDLGRRRRDRERRRR